MPAIPEFSKLLSSNSVATAYGAITRITAAAIASGANLAPIKVTARYLEFLPFGEGADGNSFNFKIVGGIKSESGGKYTNITVYEGVATLGAEVGVSGEEITNSERFCDAIVKTNGIAASSIADTETAVLTMDVRNYEYLYFTFNKDTATNANGLARFIEE